MPEVSVSNFDVLRLAMRQELKLLGSKIEKAVEKESRLIESLSADDDKLKSMDEIKSLLKNLESAILSINISPVINVESPEIPEIKIPDIIVPQSRTPDVFVNPTPVEVKASDVLIDVSSLLEALAPLQYLSNKPNSPISVRLTDGKKFLEALQAVNQNQDKMMQVFSNNTGMTSDEYVASSKRLYRSSTATNTFATVETTSAVAVVANGSRISLTLVNDSSNTIYVSKGAEAVVGSGIRLNSSGGALIIDDYTGDIYAISTGASSNLTVCEVY